LLASQEQNSSPVASHNSGFGNSIEQFFDSMAEDWHLWDEEEKGPYPVKRIFDASEKFLKINNGNNK
jgi:hypothetical protein